MRLVAFLAFGLLSGCDPVPPVATPTTSSARTEAKPPALHTDAFAVSLMKTLGMKDEDDLEGYRVPEDDVQTIGGIFKKFGIDRARLQNFHHGKFNKSMWIVWQLSPSYQIVMAISDFDDPTSHLPTNDPQRQVYTLTVRRVPIVEP